MIKEIADFTKRVVLVTEDMARLQSELKELRQDVKTLTESVLQIRAEVTAASQRENVERENFMLRVQNYLLQNAAIVDRGEPKLISSGAGDDQAIRSGTRNRKGRARPISEK